jgi:hypothetical protein
MSQLHKRFSDEQAKVLLQSYSQGKMRRVDIQEILDIGKTRFFALLNDYRQAPETFSISYQRKVPSSISMTSPRFTVHKC